MNTGNYNCITGCTDIISGKCVKYTGTYLSTLAVTNGETFDSILVKINSYLQDLPVSGLQLVTTENTSSIIFSGEGTPESPLSAVSTGPTTTPTFQEVTTAGATTNNFVAFTGINNIVNATGLHLGNNFATSLIYAGNPITSTFNGMGLQAASLSITLHDTGLQVVSETGPIFTATNINATGSFNTKMAGVPGTAPNHLATVSQIGAAGEPLWAASYDEQIVATNGIINNLVITSNLVRFTGTGVVLTGIVTQTTRAKTVVLINDTGTDINLQHLSASSSANNQLFLLGTGLVAGDNVSLGTTSAARVVYSNSKWRVTNWFGDGYHPTLRGTGTRVIEVLPSGKEIATDSFDYEYFRPDITTDQTDSALNILYPGVYRGTTVYCKNITGGGMAFKKDDDVLNTWIRIPFIV